MSGTVCYHINTDCPIVVLWPRGSLQSGVSLAIKCMWPVRLEPSDRRATDLGAESDRRGNIARPVLIFVNAIPSDEGDKTATERSERA
jgi:hypothetical protein